MATTEHSQYIYKNPNVCSTERQNNFSIILKKKSFVIGVCSIDDSVSFVAIIYIEKLVVGFLCVIFWSIIHITWLHVSFVCIFIYNKISGAPETTPFYIKMQNIFFLLNRDNLISIGISKTKTTRADITLNYLLTLLKTIWNTSNKTTNDTTHEVVYIYIKEIKKNKLWRNRKSQQNIFRFMENWNIKIIFCFMYSTLVGNGWY